MRLLVADKVNLEALSELSLLGVEIENRPELDPDSLPGALNDISILVVRSTRVTAEAIAAAPGLSLIVRAGAGYNTIDVAAASRAGVYVANCPGKNGAAVAELALGLMIALDRRIIDAHGALRDGRWLKAEYGQARGLMGRRLGVAGVGEIGRMVLERGRGLGMIPHGWSRSLSPRRAEKLGVGYTRSLVELARKSDVLSLHLPHTPQTGGIVGREVLEALPDGAMLINTARAGLVDHAALAEAVEKRGLRVGLDVYPDHPRAGTAEFAPPILATKGAGLVYGTPHIGAATEQAQHAIAVEVCRIVRAFLTHGDVPNVVNICRNTPARFALVLRCRDEIGVLANVLNVIKRHGLNVEEIANTVFDGASATCTKLMLSGRPSERCLMEIRAFHEVLHVDAIALPNMA